MILVRKDIKNFLNCESALSEIIAAIMLLAIVVLMIAIIQTQSVPEWNKEVEMDHFNVVYDDFLKIRSDIENAALFQFPRSGVIHMGAHYPGRLIFINPADTSGTLTSTNVTWINVSYKPFNQTPTYFNNSSTSIKFVPNYNYYSNAPSFVYEHGLVIKDFTTDNYIYTDTSQAIFGNNIINVFMLAYPQEFVSFSGINALNYDLQSKNSTANNTNVTVTFYTNYPRLWNASLRKYNLNPIVSGNIVTVDYPGNITINVYTFNGSIASGIGVSAITATPAPTITPSPNEYNYVFDFLNITGIVADFEKARNAGDGGASAVFYENSTIPDSHNYTYITSNINTTGATTNFTGMQSASDSGAYAILSEGAVASSNIPISPAKAIVNGTQSGSYIATRLNTNDGSNDVTIPRTIDRGQITYWDFITDNESWTNTCSGTGGTCTQQWTSSGGSNSGALESKLVGTHDDAYSRTATWQSTGFTWNNGTPDSARLDFEWRLKDWSHGAAGNTYSVILVKPDASQVYIYPNTSFTYSDRGDTWNVKYNASISPSDFSQSGTYRLKLVTLLKTQSDSDAIITFRWDNPTITLTKTSYSTDATYSFTETYPNSSWENITISDSSYGTAGTDVSIYNKTSSAWESIRTADYAGGTSDSQHVNTVILNPSNYDTGSGVIKIKYEGIDLTSSGSMGVDLLQPKFYYNNYQMNISTITSSIPVDATYVLETRYQRENANEVYNLDIWNYTTSTWENTQNLTATSWIQNNVTLTSNHISGGLVKTRFTDQTPLGTTQGNIGIDYQRIHGITTGIPSVYRLNITTNTTDIPQTSNHTLQLRYNVSRDNFTLQLWNGSSWNNRATLNDTSLSYRNVTLFSNELILYSNAGGINKYYTLVRYMDVNASATQTGTLYLDYQRIYNN